MRHGMAATTRARTELRNKAKHSAGTPATASSVRTRSHLSKLLTAFIDEYLDAYKSYSGNSAARKRLIKEILTVAQSRKDTLDCKHLSAKVVHKRLANALVKHNKSFRGANASPTSSI